MRSCRTSGYADNDSCYCDSGYCGSIYRQYKALSSGKKAVISAVAASLILLLSGCSQSTADNTAADGRYGFAYDGEGYYELSTETDDEYNIISQG